MPVSSMQAAQEELHSGGSGGGEGCRGGMAMPRARSAERGAQSRGLTDAWAENAEKDPQAERGLTV